MSRIYRNKDRKVVIWKYNTWWTKKKIALQQSFFSSCVVFSCNKRSVPMKTHSSVWVRLYLKILIWGYYSVHTFIRNLSSLLFEFTSLIYLLDFHITCCIAQNSLTITNTFYTKENKRSLPPYWCQKIWTLADPMHWYRNPMKENWMYWLILWVKTEWYLFEKIRCLNPSIKLMYQRLYERYWGIYNFKSCLAWNGNIMGSMQSRHSKWGRTQFRVVEEASSELYQGRSLHTKSWMMENLRSSSIEYRLCILSYAFTDMAPSAWVNDFWSKC